MIDVLISTGGRTDALSGPRHAWFSSRDISYCGTVTVPVSGFDAILNMSYIEIGWIIALESQLDPGKLVCLLYQSDDLLMYSGLYTCWGGSILTVAEWERLPKTRSRPQS